MVLLLNNSLYILISLIKGFESLSLINSSSLSLFLLFSELAKSLELFNLEDWLFFSFEGPAIISAGGLSSSLLILNKL